VHPTPAGIVHDSDDGDDRRGVAGGSDPDGLAERTATGPHVQRELVVDDRDGAGAGPIVIGECPPLFDVHAHRSKVSSRHRFDGSWHSRDSHRIDAAWKRQVQLRAHAARERPSRAARHSDLRIRLDRVDHADCRVPDDRRIGIAGPRERQLTEHRPMRVESEVNSLPICERLEHQQRPGREDTRARDLDRDGTLAQPARTRASSTGASAFGAERISR
jgi:hypothetical protein